MANLDIIDEALADAPAIMTRKEAAKVARMSTRELSRRVERGEIQAIKYTPGRSGPVRIPRAAIARFLRERLA